MKRKQAPFWAPALRRIKRNIEQVLIGHQNCVYDMDHAVGLNHVGNRHR
jgi:hypothetical protein